MRKHHATIELFRKTINRERRVVYDLVPSMKIVLSTGETVTLAELEERVIRGEECFGAAPRQPTVGTSNSLKFAWWKFLKQLGVVA